jgi:chromosome segregation ATPase
MEGFESVRQELIAKQEQLERDLEAARGHMSTIEADLERVHEALTALTGEKKQRRSRRSASKKPAPSVQDLQHHIAAVRAQTPFADAKAIQSSVRALVKESRLSLAGFPTLFAEALASSPGYDAPAHHPNQGHVVHHDASSHPFPG